MSQYARPPEVGSGLRLHLNENTAGCSPRVLEALRQIGPQQIAVYPDYADAIRECAAFLGVEGRQLLLTNGLDEGILAAAAATLRSSEGSAEAVIVQPAFDMYEVCATAMQGRIVPVQPRPDLSFPLAETLQAISPATRLVFLTNPNNPTGQQIPLEAIHAIARAVPAGALVFLDEAYWDFCGVTFLADLPRFPNVVIGRTFAKAYGLASLRIGAVIGDPAALKPLRRVVPPYNLNLFAVVGLQAALRDTEYHRWYLAQVVKSREMIYDACERLGLECWPSAANFVLVRTGDHAARLVSSLASRGIFIRDRSSEPGCQGCIRITAGVVEHTLRCVMAMEAVLCAER
jgi:histidinol-phosphate aminotransferase